MALSDPEIVVVGAGVAGIACAGELAAHGRDVLVLEARERAGGPAETRHEGDYLIERGPNTVRCGAGVRALAARAETALVEAARLPPALVARGRIVPLGLRSLLRGEVAPRRALLGALREPFRRHRSGAATVHEVLAERLGPALAAHVADLATLGVFGAPADRVGFASAFPEAAARLARDGSLARGLLRRRPPRSPLVSTPHGLGGLVVRAAERLGERVRLGCPARAVRGQSGGFVVEVGVSPGEQIRCRDVVLTAAPAALVPLVEDPAVGALLEGYRSTPQTLATFALEDRELAARWRCLGFLVPPRERLPLLGCLVPSALFAGRAPPGALLLSVFTAPVLREAPAPRLVRDLAPLLKRLLGSLREPVLLDVARHPDGIPLYDPGHADRTERLRRRLRESKGPLLAGGAYDGVAFSRAADSGLRAAAELLERR